MKHSNWLYGAVIVLLGLIAVAFIAIPRFRSANEQSAYETQAVTLWKQTASGYASYRDQVLSLKSSPDSVKQVCHLAKVHLQELNNITFATVVPRKYNDFNEELVNAVDVNSRYYRKVLQLCSNQALGDSATIASLTSLGNDVEITYQRLSRLGVITSSVIEWGAASHINEKIAGIFKPKEPVPAPKTIIVQSPPQGSKAHEDATAYNAFSPDHPPRIGSVVYVDTPRGGGLAFRERADTSAERVTEQRTIVDGEGLLILDRIGYWLQVQTDRGYVGYARWWYRGDCYVTP